LIKYILGSASGVADGYSRVLDFYLKLNIKIWDRNVLSCGAVMPY